MVYYNNDNEFKNRSIFILSEDFRHFFKKEDVNIQTFNDFLKKRQRSLNSLDIHSIDSIISPLIRYKGIDSNLLCFEFFSFLEKNKQEEVLDSFFSTHDSDFFTDLFYKLIHDDKYSYLFYKKALEINNFISFKETLAGILFEQKGTLSFLKGYFEENKNQNFEHLLNFFFDEKKEVNLKITLFLKFSFKEIINSNSKDIEYGKNILNLMYEKNIPFVCEPDSSNDIIKSNLFYNLITCDNQNLFTKLKENNKINIHPSIWSDEQLSYSNNLVDFININGESVSPHDLKKHLFYLNTSFNHEIITKLYHSPYISPKNDLLTIIIHNTSEILSNYNNLEDKHILFVQSLFDLCKLEPSIDISKKINRMPLNQNFKSLFLSLNEKNIINEQVNFKGNHNKIKKRI